MAYPPARPTRRRPPQTSLRLFIPTAKVARDYKFFTIGKSCQLVKPFTHEIVTRPERHRRRFGAAGKKNSFKLRSPTPMIISVLSLSIIAAAIPIWYAHAVPVTCLIASHKICESHCCSALSPSPEKDCTGGSPDRSGPI